MVNINIDSILDDKNSLLINQAINNLEKNVDYNNILCEIDNKLESLKNNQEIYYLYTLKSMYECNEVLKTSRLINNL